MALVALAVAFIILQRSNSPSKPSTHETPSALYLAASLAFDSVQSRVTTQISATPTSDPQFLSHYDAAFASDITAADSFEKSLKGISWPKRAAARARAEVLQLQRFTQFGHELVAQPTLPDLESRIIGLVPILDSLETATDALRASLGLPPLGNVSLSTPTSTVPPASGG